MTGVAAGAQTSEEGRRKRRQEKVASGKRMGAVAAVAKETPDGEGPFLAHNTPEDGARASPRPAAEEKPLALSCVPDAAGSGCKGSKSGKKGKTRATKSDDPDKKKALPGASPKKGKGKPRSKASKMKPGKAERRESSDGKAGAGQDEADGRNENVLSSHQQVPEINNMSGVMHLVAHDISELQMDKTSRRNKASSTTMPSRDLSGFNDCVEGVSGRSTVSNNNSNKNSMSNNCPESLFTGNEQDTPEKPLSLRYSVMPPLTIPREGQKEGTHNQVGGAFRDASIHKSRAPSAPSVSSVSGDSSGAKATGQTFARRSAHSSLEEALDGLLPNDILYPTRQLLTRSLASAAEKERTATIVFDLDETLCNNRQHGPAILRPGAVEMLKQLRALYPHPVLHTGETPMESTGRTSSTRGVESGKGNGAKDGCTEAAEAPTDDGVMLRLEIIIWTASVEVVARPVIARLDPDGTILDDVIYRDVRWYREGGYTKDLRRIGRHLERTIIVENAPSCVYMNRRNAILVNDFVNNPADRQLVIVRAILQEWLHNVNALLVHWHLRQLEQKRHNMVQDGGESPEPDQPMIASLTRGGSAHSSVSRGKEEVSLVSSSNGGKNVLQELEQKASAIYFLTHHPLLSPGTRYVKPSAWKMAARYLHGCGSTTPAASKPLAAAAPAAAVAGGVGGGRGPQEPSATNTARPAVAAKSRGHRSFVDMARGPREARQ